MKPTIAVLGTGRMGSSIARVLLASGYSTLVYNRSRAKCEPLVAAGARLARSVEDAVDAQIIVSCLSDYGVGDGLLGAPKVTSALRGKLLVELGSGSPRLARARAEWARTHGITYLDGAIMATPDFIGQPGCTILFSGPSEAFTRQQALFVALADNAQYVGDDVGHASALDSALLIGMWGALFGVLQGAAICQAENVSLDAYRRYFQAIHPVVDGGTTDMLRRIEKREFQADERTLAALDAHDGAFQHVRELCRHHRLNDAVPAAFAQLFDAAKLAGHATDDFAVLSEFVRAPG